MRFNRLHPGSPLLRAEADDRRIPPAVAALVKFLDRAKQLVIRLVSVAYNALVRVAVGGIYALVLGIVIHVLEPIPTHTDLGFEEREREILIKEAASSTISPTAMERFRGSKSDKTAPSNPSPS
jgi:hypothetical protein